MVRAVPALLLLLAGCDRVLQLDRDDPPPLCGPFGPPSLVPFHPELVGPRDFSVDYGGTRGMVYAQYPRTTRPTGVHTIKLEGGMWRADPARDTGAITSLDGGHIGENNFAIGWLAKEGGDLPDLREYEFRTPGNAWNQSTSEAVELQPSQTSIAGNVIVLPYAGVATIRFVVTILLSDREGEPNTMRIFELAPNETKWGLTRQADPLKTSKALINPSGGVMTADHGTLVYAARVGEDDTTSQLYMSERIRDEFAPGVQIEIEGVDRDEDLTEPWINADCTNLYFRRDGATWMATAVDDPASEP